MSDFNEWLKEKMAEMQKLLPIDLTNALKIYQANAATGMNSKVRRVAKAMCAVRGTLPTTCAACNSDVGCLGVSEEKAARAAIAEISAMIDEALK